MTTRRSASSLLTMARQTPIGSPAVYRRQWLTRWSAAVGGVVLWQLVGRAQQLPPGAGVAAMPSCDPNAKLTPARTVAGFQAGAPLRSRLTDAGERWPGLNLTGTVAGIRCGIIAGASVDIWHADGTGAVGAAAALWRARQTTDALGRYTFDTIVPGAAIGQAPRINMRVSVPGKSTLTTAVFLPEAMAAAANKHDRAYDPLLAMTLLSRTADRASASFNVILDL